MQLNLKFQHRRERKYITKHFSDNILEEPDVKLFPNKVVIRLVSIKSNEHTRQRARGRQKKKINHVYRNADYRIYWGSDVFPEAARAKWPNWTASWHTV